MVNIARAKMIAELGALVRIAICLVLAVLFMTLVVGAPNSHVAVKSMQKDSVSQSLVNCRTVGFYPDLSDWNFMPRKVKLQDTACLTFRMIEDMSFIDHFNISTDILSRFIFQAQRGYRNVPYHNWFHGFEVLQYSFAVLKNCQVTEKHHLTQLEGLALLTAAMCHDIDHPGTNNEFQKEINSSLAQEYGVQGSILERHHSAVTMRLLTSPETNFMAHLDNEQRSSFYDLISQTILATDLQLNYKKIRDEKSLTASRFDKQQPQERHLLRSAIIICADLSSSARPWFTVPSTVKLIFEEFFAQGDQEKQLGLKPTKMMDRNLANIAEVQIDFLSNVVIPLYQVLLAMYPEVEASMKNLQTNMGNWRKAVPYFQNQRNLGRLQMDIIKDCSSRLI